MELEVRNPVDGKVVGRVPVSTPQEVGKAFTRARVAQEKWRHLAGSDRARVLIRFHDLILDREDLILDTIQSETGKTRRDAFAEVYSLAGTARYYAYHGLGFLGDRRRRGAFPALTGARVVRKPWGVVGLITPWNFPFLLAMDDALPALLAGNAVLLKPSERAPLSAILGRQLLLEAGLDPNLIILVHGGAEAGAAVVEGSNYMAFTGGKEAGKAVATRAAGRLIPYSLEMGGKNAMIVTRGARLDAVVEGLVAAAFVNCGQACLSVERVYVEGPLYDEFLERAARRIRNLKMGGSEQWDLDIGSLIGADHLRKVYGHISDAVEKGARVIVGGRPRPDLGPAFLEPTMLADVSPDALISREETFGPVVTVHRVADREEALQKANDSPYGLNATVWGEKGGRSVDLSRRLDAGSVGINSTLQIYSSFDVPMGGTKSSGIGRRHGAEGIRRFSQLQSIVTGPSRWGGYDSILTRLRSDQAASLLRLVLKIWRRLPGIR